MPYFFIAYIVQAVIFGFATKIVIQNKGYYENWFWWGFFFGIIALLVASSQPHNFDHSTNSKPAQPVGWRCTCGKEHPTYVSSCSCGISRHDILDARYKANQREMQKEAVIKDEVNKATAIREYKGLMDAGIISSEEFDAKKNQLLGI